MKFTARELQTISNALEHARLAYVAYANVARGEEQPRIAEQFDRQAEDCRALVDRIEAEG